MSVRRALVCALMPEFDRDSGSKRVFDLIDLLREAGWAVTFVSHHAKCGRRYMEVLQQRGVAVYAGASEHMPSLIASGLFDVALFGLWHIAEPFLASIRQQSPATRIIVDSVDLHFLRNARRLLTERRADGAHALDGTYASELVREINTYDAADAVLTVSEKEATLVNDFLGKRSAFLVPDCEAGEPSPVGLSNRKGIVLVGCYRHRPNADAVRFLCEEIVPLIDSRVLAMHPIQIVGDGLDEELRQLGADLPFVRMVGWVPSIFPYIERARLTVLPLRYGAGTKRKLLQALTVGTPAVSTSIGAEGFDLIDRKHVLIADDPVAFAQAVTELVRNDRLWRRLARDGRSRIAALHSRDAARSKLMSAVEAVFALPPRRSSRSASAVTRRADHYAQLVLTVREVVSRSLPRGVTVAVVSKGDEAFLNVDGRTMWHFPRANDGKYAGWYPADDDEAIRQVSALVDHGARYLVFPATATWWLTHYSRLRAYLDRIGQEIVTGSDACVTYALDKQAAHVASATASASRVADTAADISVGRDLAEPAVQPNSPVRLIAFMLPQFHPIPENDAWWGKGFTEWTNVTRAKPLFPDHYQPRIPADLGFYDLRLADTREMQAQLARDHGIYGFCYYHYWFSGKMLLERPFNEVLATGRPDMPFCLCWANEPWSRRWDGQPRDVLQAQTYSLDDDRRHIEWLIPALNDPRAITIEGKPVFVVYQANDLPDPQRTVEIWRTEVERAGLEGLYLIAVETGWDAGWDATKVGFDAKVLFQPQFSMLRTVPRSPVSSANGIEAYDYDAAWPILAKPEPVPYRRYSTVFPSWDNAARRGSTAVVIHGATPASYEAWLRQTVEQAQRESPEHRVVFINAWNEWAEGCHLEPDVKYGRGFLEATARAMSAATRLDVVPTTPDRTVSRQKIPPPNSTSSRRMRGHERGIVERPAVLGNVHRRHQAADRGLRR